MSANIAQNAEPTPAELATPTPPAQGSTVLVCGDRAWTDGFLILRTLQAIPGVSRVIHGGCRGADLLGGWAARQLGIAVEVYPADWEGEGRAAGPKSNQRMLHEGHPGLVLAFHDDLPHSLGTRDTLIRATQARIPFRVVSHARPEGTGSKALASMDAYAGRRVEVGTTSGPLAGIPAAEPPTQDPPRGTTRFCERRPGFSWRRDGSRTSLAARLCKPLEGFGGGDEDGVDDRRFSVLDVTSGLPDDSRDEDQHVRALVERQRQGRVRAAQAALQAHPGAQELVYCDQTRLRMFCARFGVTPNDICPQGETPVERCSWCRGGHGGFRPIHVEDATEVLRSPCDWLSEVRAREAACLPGTEGR